MKKGRKRTYAFSVQAHRELFSNRRQLNYEVHHTAGFTRAATWQEAMEFVEAEALRRYPREGKWREHSFSMAVVPSLRDRAGVALARALVRLRAAAWGWGAKG